MRVFLAIWALLAVATIGPPVAGNETEVLPFARHGFDPDWLSRDWYLSLEIGYRRLFSWVAGPLLSAFSFETAARILRVASCGLAAWGVAGLARGVRLDLRVAIVWAWWFLLAQGMIAGEWMLGAADTKCFAYACVLLALPAACERRYGSAAAWLGGAMSFHVLVGAYATACVGAALFSLSEDRRAWRDAFRRSWPILATGVFGWIAIGEQLARRTAISEADALEAAVFHATTRIPHHVVPGAWGSVSTWLPEVLAWTAVLLLFACGSDRRTRLPARIGLAALGLFAVGLGVDAAGRPDLAIYYWFRIGDVLAPLLGSLCIAVAVSDLLAGRAPAGLRPRWHLPGRSRAVAGYAASLAVALMFVIVALPWTIDRPIRLPGRRIAPVSWERRPDARLEVMHWIREHTPVDAVVLVDPAVMDFHVEAERATVVSWKQVPESEADWIEWRTRLADLGGRFPLPAASFRRKMAILSAYYQGLTAGQIRVIAKRYGADHVLTQNAALPFEEVYRRGGWRVLDLSQDDPPPAGS